MALSLLLFSACTSGDPPEPGPSGLPATAKAGPTATVTFVGSVSVPGADAQHLEAVRLAVEEVNAGPLPVRIDLEVLDDRGTAEAAEQSVLAAARSSAAVIYSGPGAPLSRIRPELEPTQTPVLLLEGDLYTTRGLYSNVFQVSLPLLWQARVLAHYLHVRGEQSATALHDGEELGASRAAWTSAAAEEGIGESPAEPAIPEGSPVVVLGDTGQAPFGTPSPQILSTDELLSSPPADAPAPGTVVVSAYAWSGWAEPLPRVRRFRDAFRTEFGRLPVGTEQHAYDALHVLALSLADTQGRRGQHLIDRLEQVKHRFVSFMPVRLGPDDHTFYDDWTLGVFAVAGPSEEVEPWMQGTTPWRPVMRSFTADEERVTIWERDLRPFFPRWRRPAPSPKYWWSRLGIVTRHGDPLH